MTQVRRFLAPLGFVLFAVGAFLLSRLAARTIYGLDGGISEMLLADVFSDILPVVAMFCALLVLPKVARGALSQHWPQLTRAIMLCVALFLATAATIAVGVSNASSAVTASITPWMGLAFDLCLVVTLAAAVLTMARNRLVAILAMMVYVALVAMLGPMLGILQYIGFGTTPHQLTSRFSTWPVGAEIAWTWRFYWLAILSALVLWVAWDKQVNSRRRLAAVAGCALVAASLGWLGHAQAVRARATTPSASAALPQEFARLDLRPDIEAFRLRVDLSSPGPIQVDGSATLINRSPYPLDHVLLEHGASLKLATIEGPAIASRWMGASPRLAGLRLRAPLRPGEALEIRFSGRIDRHPMGTPAAARFLVERGSFLPQGALLPAPRTAVCAVPPRSRELQCGAGENFLLGDMPRGSVTVAVPNGWTVAGAVPLGANAGYRLEVEPRQRGNFIVAAAPYRVTAFGVAPSCPALAVYLAPGSTTRAGELREVFCSEWSGLAKDFGVDTGLGQWIAEVPEHIALGLSLRNGIVISERLLEAGASTPIVRQVVGHEIAHRIWGYDIAPEKAPGEQFVLEALPQYLALTNRPSSKSLTATMADLDAYRKIQGGPVELTEHLWQSSNPSDSYLSQPRALLAVDDMGNADARPVRQALISAYKTIASKRTGPVSPSEVVAVIANSLPAPERARFYSSLGIDHSDPGRGPK